MAVRSGDALLRRLDGPEDGLFPRLAAARDLFDTEEAFQQVRTRQRSPRSHWHARALRGDLTLVQPCLSSRRTEVQHGDSSTLALSWTGGVT